MIKIYFYILEPSQIHYNLLYKAWYLKGFFKIFIIVFNDLHLALHKHFY